MIQKFVDRFMSREGDLRQRLAGGHPDKYEDIVRMVVECVSVDDYGDPDPGRIHVIDDGDYQGTLVFVVGANGYQPYRYWYVKVEYGSCSGCDTLECIRGYSGKTPSEQQVNDYWTLCLHVVQGLRQMADPEEI